MAWTVTIILIGGLLADLALRYLAARLILPVFERKPPFGQAPQILEESGEVVRFPTTNGLELCGRMYRQPFRQSRGVIVFCPEMEGDSTSALFYCEALWNAGFDIFAFDFRGQGQSDSLPGYEPLHWVTEYEVEDTLAAVRCVRSLEHGAERLIGVLGISRGGGAALAAAARCADIGRVAVEGAFTTEGLLEYYTLRWAELYIPRWLMNLFPLWHVRGTLALVRRISQSRRHCRYVRLERELPRLKRKQKPVLMIHGARDNYVPPETAHQLVRHLPAGRQYWLVPEANHNKARATHPAEYDRRLLEFFDHAASPRRPKIANQEAREEFLTPIAPGS